MNRIKHGGTREIDEIRPSSINKIDQFPLILWGGKHNSNRIIVF